MPILGITASSKLGVTGAFESIATATGTGSSGTITFSSIPSTYQHLQIRMISRHDGPSSGNGANLITFNSDTGNNYTLHSLRGSGSAASAVGYATGTYAGVLIEGVPGDLTTSNVYGVSIVDIHDYASTSKYKTARIFGGLDRNDTFGLIRLNSSLWLDTSAISTITVTNVNGANFKTGSTFALYGIKGA